MRFPLFVCALILCGMGSGCRSIGPRTVPRDRLDYSRSISESWKHQVLLNLVRMRYLDTPVFLDVGQIISGYTLETAINMSGEMARTGAGDTFMGLGVGGTYTDRPTITYTPLTGQEFLRSIITPIPSRHVFGLLHAGYTADFVLELTLSRFNGLQNYSIVGGKTRPADLSFLQAIASLARIQQAGALGFRLNMGAQDQTATELVFLDDQVPEQTRAEIGLVKQLLGLNQTTNVYKLVDGSLPGADGELTVNSRSVLQIMNTLAGFVQVPPKDVEEMRTFESMDVHSDSKPLLRVLSGASAPKDAYVAVGYRDRWFWVDDRDLESKRTISALQFLFILSDKNDKLQPPQITIPAQ